MTQQHPQTYLDTLAERAHRRAARRQTAMIIATIASIIAVIVAAAALFSPSNIGVAATVIAVGSVVIYYFCAWLEDRL